MRRFLLALSFLQFWCVLGVGPASASVLIMHCKYANSNQVDPIVSPGIAPSAHMHDFFGNTGVDQNSTADSLLGNATTCRTSGDTAAYWFPQPVVNGVATVSTGTMGEYWNGAKHGVATPPHGMTYVAGNGHAEAATDNPHLTWTCGDSSSTLGSPAPKDCTNASAGSKHVTAVLVFAPCWDGTTAFDSPAGISTSHFVYLDGSSCPSGYTRIARLVTHTHFLDPRTGGIMVNPYNADGSLALSFSSGPYYTFHGDYLNSWNQPALDALIQGCLNQSGVCPPHA